MKEAGSIDFVVTWVDGSDPQWLAERDRYAELEPEALSRNPTRYRDWKILKYWFRAVETYAPWVRTVHFVTCGHVPAWLDTSNPKLHVVRHADFIPPEYLPTFNSNAIEMFLHRIPGLAEQFVYLNDDVFVTAPVKPEFFFRKGLPRDFFELNGIRFTSGNISHTIGSCVSLVNDNFSPRKTFKAHWRKMLSPRNGLKSVLRTILIGLLFPDCYLSLTGRHCFIAFRKRTFEEVWEKAGDQLRTTASHRFRKPGDVSPWAFRYWQLASGAFFPASPHPYECVQLFDSRVDGACEMVRRRSRAVLCLNDSSRLKQVGVAARKVRDALESVLPERSSFEKEEGVL